MSGSMSSEFPEVRADTPTCREASRGCPHVSVRVPRGHLGLSPAAVTSVFFCTCFSAEHRQGVTRVTYPLTAEHQQQFTPSVAPNCLHSPDVLFNKNLSRLHTRDMFLILSPRGKSPDHGQRVPRAHARRLPPQVTVSPPRSDPSGAS